MKAPSVNKKALELPYDIIYLPLGAAAFGGAERSILELAAAQQALGRRVLVCYPAALASTDFPARAAQMAVPIHQTTWEPEQGLLAVLKEAWRFFRHCNADVVHFNISWRRHMWCLPLVARLASTAKLVGTMRAMPEAFADLPHKKYLGVIPGPRVWAWSDYVFGRVWARCLHAAVSVNRDDYPPQMVRSFGFNRRRLSVIYNGVEVPERLPSAAERSSARLALGLDPALFHVGYVGRVSPEKGITFLLDAMAEIGNGCSLVVAGDGAEMDAMKQRIDEHGLGGSVRFLGYVSKPAAVFEAVDVLVVPSLWNEAFGRVVVEAMARGAVVVATSVGGMQEIFVHRQEGLQVPRANSSAIAASIRELMADKKLREGLSAAGFECARQKFSIARVCEQYGALYARLVAAG